MTRLGNPADPATAALVLSAAELTVAAEKARADLLAGNGDLNGAIRIENLVNRALKRLGLNKPAPKPSGPSLREYVSAKYGRLPIAPSDDASSKTSVADEGTSEPASGPSGRDR
jgi:hypothetical protein